MQKFCFTFFSLFRYTRILRKESIFLDLNPWFFFFNATKLFIPRSWVHVYVYIRRSQRVPRDKLAPSFVLVIRRGRVGFPVNPATRRVLREYRGYAATIYEWVKSKQLTPGPARRGATRSDEAQGSRGSQGPQEPRRDKSPYPARSQVSQAYIRRPTANDATRQFLRRRFRTGRGRVARHETHLLRNSYIHMHM